MELYRGQPHIAASLVLAAAYAGWAGSLPPEEKVRGFLHSIGDKACIAP